MPKKSAGLLLYRKVDGAIEVFLGHPGGPFWVKKDDGAWSIPKAEFDVGENPLDAAKREFQEETGFVAEGEFQPLKPVRQRGGKIVYSWAVHFDLDASAVKSNTFSMEWPPGSGRMREFPEIDRAGWFKINLAKRKILKSQLDLLDQLEKTVAARVGGTTIQPLADGGA
jgi:predicted NUDIX family NTP pyrophosphohydrolase